MSSITPDDRRRMVEGMIALHAEIHAEITGETNDPRRLMRLLGAGMNQCLIALAHLLDPDALADTQKEA